MKFDVGDYYSAAVGKFEIIGQFKAAGLNGNTRPATLDLGITLEWKFKR